jgi:hypothetical protein
MPGISALGDTVLPPSASICFRDSSIESTWMTILGVGVLRGARREAAVDRTRLRRHLRLLIDGSREGDSVVVALHRLEPPIESAVQDDRQPVSYEDGREHPSRLDKLAIGNRLPVHRG